MSNCKDELINVILHSMIDKIDSKQFDQLKDCLQISFYNYTIEKLETTEISCGCENTTKELIEYFSICKLGSGRSRNTIKQYIRVVHQLCEMVHKELNMITSDDIIYFLAKYPYTKTPNVSKCTMDSKRRYLSSVFSLLKKHKKIAENPMDMVDGIKYRSKVKEIFSENEIDNIYKTINKTKNETTRCRNTAIVQLFLDSGLRVSELANININDVDFNKKEIKVIGKGSKERIIFFSESTKDKIIDYLKLRNKNNTDDNYGNDHPLFMDITNKNRLLSSGIRSMVKRVGSVSGIHNVHPHRFRRTCATNLAVNNVPIDVISDYLGHSNLSVVQKYVINSQDRMKSELYKVGIGGN